MLKIPNPNELKLDPLERLPVDVRLLVKEKGTLKEYSPGDTLMAPGDIGDRIRFLISGEASVMLRDGDAQEIAVDVIRPGDMFGEISFLTGSPSPANSGLVADELCRVLEISANEFEEILRGNPDLTMMLVKNLARKIMRLDPKGRLYSL
jgi:CRP-like cAMP-binding protein